MNLQRPTSTHATRTVVSVRHDSWEAAPGAWRFLFAVRAGEACAVFLAALDPGTMRWTQGRAIFQDWGFELDRALLERAVRMEPAEWRFLAPLGAFRKGPDVHAAQLGMIVEALKGGFVPPDPWLESRTRAIMTGPAVLAWEDRPHGAIATALGNEEPHGRLLDGATSEALPESWMGRFLPRQPAESRLDLIDEGTANYGFGVGRSQWRLSGSTESWCGALARSAWPPALRFLKPAHWSQEAFSYFMDPALGHYRRQAGDAFPFLAPLIHHDGELRRLVDAGRPYEARLVEVLTAWLPPGAAPGLTVAKLRRMRGMRREFTPKALGAFLPFVARLPVDLVGPVAIAWDSRSGPDMDGLAEWADAGGLDPADLMRSHASLDLKDGRRLLGAARDMALNLSMDLVQPAMPAGTPHDALDRRAMQVLFGGRTLDAILRLSARWHANLSRFHDAMPAGEDRVSWPAGFRDYVPDGMPDVLLTCLTKPSELKMEGSYGRDDVAGAGLRNCVAGYGPTCHARRRHVASLRRRVGDAWERVSTVEFSIEPRRRMERVEGRPDPSATVRTMVPKVIQHQASGNTPPPRWAVSVVDGFVDAVGNGRIVLPEEAPVAERPYDDGLDRSDPATRAAILDAWRPYLPRHLATGTAESFDEFVATLR